MPSSNGFSLMMNKNFNAMTAAYEKHVQVFLEKTATKYELSLEELKESWKEYDVTSTISFSLKKKKGSGNESNGLLTTVKKPKQMPFIVFSNRHRAIMKEQNPNAKHIDIAKLLGQKWKALSKEEQSQYYIQIPTVATEPLTIEPLTTEPLTTITTTTHLPPPRQLFGSSSDSQEEDEDEDMISSSSSSSSSAPVVSRPRNTPLPKKMQKKKTESVIRGGDNNDDNDANDVNNDANDVNNDNSMFGSKKIKELRQLCSEQGLSVDGKKEVLIQRLMNKLNSTRVPTSPSAAYHDEEEPRLNTTQLDQSDDEENEFEYNASDSD